MSVVCSLSAVLLELPGEEFRADLHWRSIGRKDFAVILICAAYHFRSLSFFRLQPVQPYKEQSNRFNQMVKKDSRNFLKPCRNRGFLKFFGISGAVRGCEGGSLGVVSREWGCGQVRKCLEDLYSFPVFLDRGQENPAGIGVFVG